MVGRDVAERLHTCIRTLTLYDGENGPLVLNISSREVRLATVRSEFARLGVEEADLHAQL